MKNKLLHLLLSILVGTAGLSAQESGSVTVNITLHPIHIITVNPSQKTVQMDYVTEADYRDGVTSLQSGHLSVFSTGAFAVTARSLDPVLRADGAGQEMSLSALQIAALLPEGTSGNNQGSWIKLSQYPESIISSGNAMNQTNFDILYKGAGNNVFMEKIDATKERNLFSAKIIYSVETK